MGFPASFMIDGIAFWFKTFAFPDYTKSKYKYFFIKLWMFDKNVTVRAGELRIELAPAACKLGVIAAQLWKHYNSYSEIIESNQSYKGVIFRSG